MKKQSYFTASRISFIGIFAALSFGLYMFPTFPLPFIPAFLKLNFSDVPGLLAGFLLDPLAAVIVIVVKILLKLPFSESAYVGELADLVIGLAFVLPPSIIYHKCRRLKAALWGIIAGAVASIAAAIVSNILFIVPFYITAYFGGNIAPLVEMCKVFIPSISADNFYAPYLLLAVLPFNLIRCTVAGILTFLLYKRVSVLFHKMKK